MMDKYKIIRDIIESQNTLEKIVKFERYEQLLGDCRFFLFDEECSNFDKSVKNITFDKCHILGMGDYSKTWVLDANHLTNVSYLLTGKTIDLDLNILTYLHRIITGRKLLIAKSEVIRYLSYLKKEGFQIGMATAIMERAQNKLGMNIFEEMITSFVKFDKMKKFDENNLDISLSKSDYERINQILQLTMEKQYDDTKQFDILCCCVMKAFLIKKYDRIPVNKKIEKLIDYCFHVLNCYPEKEIIILSLYIKDDGQANKIFSKMKENNDIIKNIENAVWDLYHIRLIESMMLERNIHNPKTVILPYYGTADQGIYYAMSTNPIKEFVIVDDHYIAIHQKNIYDICSNHQMLYQLYQETHLRQENITKINFSQIKQQLKTEILNQIQRKAQNNNI